MLGFSQTSEKSATDAWADSQIPQMPLPEQPSEGIDQIMHVIEVKPDDPKMPADIAAYLRKAAGGAAVVVGAIILSIAIGLAIDWIDKRTGVTESISKRLRTGSEYLEKKMPADYGNYDSALQQAIAYGGMGA